MNIILNFVAINKVLDKITSIYCLNIAINPLFCNQIIYEILVVFDETT